MTYALLCRDGIDRIGELFGSEVEARRAEMRHLPCPVGTHRHTLRREVTVEIPEREKRTVAA